MSNHPNRSKQSTAPKAPTSAEARAAREAAGLTQTAAANLIYVTLSAWQRWAQGERDMHPAFWELWQIKAASLQRPDDWVLLSTQEATPAERAKGVTHKSIYGRPGSPAMTGGSGPTYSFKTTFVMPELPRRKG